MNIDITLLKKIDWWNDEHINFGNIDIDWQIQLDLTVNQYVKANIGTHLVYDDDIKSKEEEGGVQVVKGPKIQLKQLLGLGVVYQF